VSKKILARGSKYTGNDIRIDDQEYLILREEEEANDNSF
jgi:co-chaperonin GroES (HSP10)